VTSTSGALDLLVDTQAVPVDQGMDSILKSRRSRQPQKASLWCKIGTKHLHMKSGTAPSGGWEDRCDIGHLREFISEKNRAIRMKAPIQSRTIGTKGLTFNRSSRIRAYWRIRSYCASMCTGLKSTLSLKYTAMDAVAAVFALVMMDLSRRLRPHGSSEPAFQSSDPGVCCR
jgi:hypothetical protein